MVQLVLLFCLARSGQFHINEDGHIIPILSEILQISRNGNVCGQTRKRKVLSRCECSLQIATLSLFELLFHLFFDFPKFTFQNSVVFRIVVHSFCFILNVDRVPGLGWIQLFKIQWLFQMIPAIESVPLFWQILLKIWKHNSCAVSESKTTAYWPDRPIYRIFRTRNSVDTAISANISENKRAIGSIVLVAL